jgi:hypothetical protein
MEMNDAPVRMGEAVQLNWAQWQRAVVERLRADASGLLRFIDVDEVDWDAWRGLYAEGRTPESAVDRALARDY